VFVKRCGEVQVHKFRIAVVIAIGLILLTTFCSVSFAKDQGQALIEAAKQGDLERVRELLDKGADVNARNINDMTVLISAARGGNLEIVKLLLEKGSDINARASNGFTAMKQASKEGHTQIVELLKAHGAKE
jgi:uncharacterized protein